MNTKKIIYWVLTTLITVIFIASGIGKLTADPTSEMVIGLGGIHNAYILGGLELLFALLFLFPRTGLIGALFLMTYMGGAIAFHFTKGESVAVQLGIQSFVWAVSFYRFPELYHRLLKSTKN